jgi:predicted type IV restriction endonuclease
MDYETARRNLQSLRDWYQGHSGERNEATTRLHLINRLFFDCLAWEEEETILEESHGGQFADYTFFSPRKIMIIEAKKEGEYFEVPAGLAQS